MKDLVQTFAKTSDQDVDIRHDPYDVLKRIVEAIPAHAGLKDENGRLKGAYPGNTRFVDTSKLQYDAATLADVACYRMQFSPGMGGHLMIMNVDVILEAVRSIPREDSGEAFKKLCSDALEQRDKVDGRQHDNEEAASWYKRRALVQRYRAESKPMVANTHFIEQPLLPKVRKG